MKKERTLGTAVNSETSSLNGVVVVSERETSEELIPGLETYLDEDSTVFLVRRRCEFAEEEAVLNVRIKAGPPASEEDLYSLVAEGYQLIGTDEVLDLLMESINLLSSNEDCALRFTAIPLVRMDSYLVRQVLVPGDWYSTETESINEARKDILRIFQDCFCRARGHMTVEFAPGEKDSRVINVSSDCGNLHLIVD